MNNNIDITELLEEYVMFLEKGYIPRESTESKIMLQASEEIKRLRKSLEFQIELADDYNKSRLHYQDKVIALYRLYEQLCKEVDIDVKNSFICSRCLRHGDCDNEKKTPYCFKLSYNKLDDMVKNEIEKFNELGQVV